MKKTTSALTLILALLFSIVVGMHVVAASSQTDYPLASGIYIISPSNRTYSSRLLTLNVSVTTLAGSNIDISMTYSLDGMYNDTIPIVIHSRDNSFQSTITGLVTLPELPYGSHSVTVYAEYDLYNVGMNGVYYQKYIHLDNSTVYFTIGDVTSPFAGDTTPPIISNLSIENKTYNSAEIPLSFNIDKTVSWIAYCLDNQANITIAGLYNPEIWGRQFNTTLTGLSDGSHNLIVYANDTAGNTGVSVIVWFTVETVPPSPIMPSSFQSLTTSPNQPQAFYQEVAYGIAVTIVALTILAVALALRKHPAGQNLKNSTH